MGKSYLIQILSPVQSLRIPIDITLILKMTYVYLLSEEIGESRDLISHSERLEHA